MSCYYIFCPDYMSDAVVIEMRSLFYFRMPNSVTMIVFFANIGLLERVFIAE